MKKEVKTITVEEAKSLLEGHVNARPLSQEMVDQMVADIKEGTFDKENANVLLDRNGKLSNGQHIMHAIIEADQALELNVFTEEKYDMIPAGYVNRNSKYRYVSPLRRHMPHIHLRKQENNEQK